MKLRLYVEDRYFQAYEVLAEKWHKTKQGQCEVDLVRAVHLHLDRMRDEMRRYVVRALKDGFNCVVFMVDQEAPHERSELIHDIRSAFDQLCREIVSGRNLRGLKVGLFIVRSCLECWLLTEAQAIVRFACRRGKRVSYNPRQRGDTELLSPRRASGEITHILRKVAKKAGKRNLKRVKYEKSAVPDMIEQMSELPQAARRNRSLSHFFTLVAGERSGCDQPQSDDEF